MLNLKSKVRTSRIIEGPYQRLGKWFRCFSGRLPRHVADFENCVGTDRFLGTHYGLFLRDWSTIDDDRFWEVVTELSMCLRTAVVLHDHSVDHSLDDAQLGAVEEACEQLLVMAEAAITHILGSGTESRWLLDQSVQRRDRAYSRLREGESPSMDLVVGKCSHVAVPLQVVSRVDSQFPEDRVCTSVSRYLFALQCLDDFHDIEEDYHGQTNHNLFVWSMDRSLFEAFCQYRLRLLPYVASYLMANLQAMRQNLESEAPRASLFRELLHRSGSHLSRWSKLAMPDSARLWGTSWRFEDYEPPKTRPEAFALFLRQLRSAREAQGLSDFRADKMHSLSALVVDQGQGNLPNSGQSEPPL